MEVVGYYCQTWKNPTWWMKSSTVESQHQNRVKKGAGDGGIGSMLSSDHVQGGRNRWGPGLGKVAPSEVEGKIPGAPIFDASF